MKGFFGEEGGYEEVRAEVTGSVGVGADVRNIRSHHFTLSKDDKVADRGSIRLNVSGYLVVD
jgi:hypothetical protein